MNDVYQAYLKSVSRFSLLSKEEEKNLTQAYLSNKDPKIRSKLINSNLRLVVKIALSYRKSGIANLDLIQEGNIGLIKGVENFNPQLSVPLANYAAMWIRAYMLKYIVSNHRLIKIGTTEAQKRMFFNLQKERDALAAQGIVVSNEELAHKFEITEKEVEEMSMRMACPEVSITHEDSEDMRGCVSEEVLEGSIERPDALLDSYRRQQIISSLLKNFETRLTPTHKIIFEKRILEEVPEFSLEEIGKEIGVTKQRVQQIEAELKRKLNTYFKSNKVSPESLGL